MIIFIRNNHLYLDVAIRAVCADCISNRIYGGVAEIKLVVVKFDPEQPRRHVLFDLVASDSVMQFHHPSVFKDACIFTPVHRPIKCKIGDRSTCRWRGSSELNTFVR